MADRKNWFHAAGKIWPSLIAAATSEKLLTYGQLAPIIPTNPLNVGRALGPIQDYCLENKLAPLTSIVVGKVSGKPGDGFIAWDVDDIESAIQSVKQQNWDLVGNPFSNFGPKDDIDSFAKELVDKPESSELVYRKVRDRGVAQQVFRRALLLAYKGKCAFCGLSFEDALEAAHIVPWSKCSSTDRLDVRNGVLLCATHHKLFDMGAISITPNLRINFYDPTGIDGPYGESDRQISLDLHDRRLHLPLSEHLHPNPIFVNKRNAKQGD